MLSNNPHGDKSYTTHLLQEVLEESIELVHELVEKLGAGNVHAVVDGELLVAEIVVGGRAGFQDLSVCVLILDLPNLPQQGIQMLNEEMENTQHCDTACDLLHDLEPNIKMNKPFLTGQLCRCRDQSTLVFVASWSPYQYQRSTTTRKEKQVRN